MTGIAVGVATVVILLSIIAILVIKLKKKKHGNAGYQRTLCRNSKRALCTGKAALCLMSWAQRVELWNSVSGIRLNYLDIAAQWRLGTLRNRVNDRSHLNSRRWDTLVLQFCYRASQNSAYDTT
jgi:hypothetical protein